MVQISGPKIRPNQNSVPKIRPKKYTPKLWSKTSVQNSGSKNYYDPKLRSKTSVQNTGPKFRFKIPIQNSGPSFCEILFPMLVTCESSCGARRACGARRLLQSAYKSSPRLLHFFKQWYGKSPRDLRRTSCLPSLSLPADLSSLWMASLNPKP